MKWWFRQKLYTQILVCIVIGVTLGLTLGERVSVIQPVGTAFIRLLKMLIVPLTFLTLVAGLTKLDGVKSLRSIGGMTLLYYAASSLLAGGIGMTLALILQPGKGMELKQAAGTTSSAATLPISMGVAQENLGASEKVFGLTLPLGATINMDGMASCIGVIAVFSCNLYGMAITPALMLQFLFLGLVMSIGTAGVKGAGIVTSTILLQATGVPTVVIVPILASVWPVLDIGNTCCNVTGDLTATAVLASRFGMLDEGVFNDRTTGLRTGQTASDDKTGDGRQEP